LLNKFSTIAQLPPTITEIANPITQQALNVIHESTKVELILVDSFGETEQILPYLDEMKNVSEEAIRAYSQLYNYKLPKLNLLPHLLC
jgi:hypothetical protein